ncbi:MAG TPA: hypothetical protein VL326_38600 [Kofleriaceae bacterium]|jgi:hypothetical protein|nr:hypothetical protein [Kofleriaceae bacterium]
MRLAFALALVGLVGCVTPSIPIPPPDPSKMTFTVETDPTSGEVTGASLAYPPTDSYKGGVAYLYNRTLGHGVIEAVNADGSIGPTAVVAASTGNQIVFSVENDMQTVSTCVLLKDGAPTSYCP